MTSINQPTDSTSPTGKPIVTWAFMALATVVVLLMPDWSGSGSTRPLWLFLVPIALGIAGAAFALRSRHIWWAMISGLWGFALIQGLVLLVTLVSGP
ncbi:hypothetical protein [Arthrobacter sp. HLT1-20]